jgi:RND family efflux transporter MFP subunit
MKKLIFPVMILSAVVLSFVAGNWYGIKGLGGLRIIASDKSNTGPSGTPVGADAAAEEEDSGAEMASGAVKISPARQQRIGVKVAAVEKKPMTYTLRLYGRVAPDETRLFRLNASTDSWVREISGASTGSLVEKNEILAEMLAPSFFNAQNNYVIQLGQMDRIRQQLGGELRPQQTEIADSQIRMAVQSLQTLGVGDAQIAELARTRKASPYLQVRAPAKGVVLSRKVTLNQWFKAGDEFYTIADIARIWVYADVYEDEALHMRPGAAVAVRHDQTGRTFEAKIGRVLPLFDPSTRTLKVRIDVDNPRYDLRPDMFVDVEIPIAMPESVHVPAGAVLDTGKRAIVYVDMGNGIFEPRRVKTGWSLGGQVEILHGLAAGEKIVAAGNFLIDSESRMALAASGAEAEERDDAPVHGKSVDKGQGPDWAAMLQEKSPVSTKPPVPPKAKRDATTKRPPKVAAPDNEDDSEEDRQGTYPFPGAQYLGTVPRDPAPAKGEPPKDKLPPGRFEPSAAPPSGTRLK